jgi:hypothetical protein
MNTDLQKHQKRWRLSEETTAELTYARRESTHPSWDAFFLAMLSKWKQNSTEPTSDNPKKSLKVFDQCFKNLDARLIELKGFMETQEQLLQSLERGHEQICELMQRTNLLLALAMEIEESQPPETSPNPESPLPLSERQRVIQQLRKHRS